MMLFKSKKIGLALGGGGVRALSSIGVLKKLQNNNVKISYIAGTSMGSIIGGMYAYYQDIYEVEKRVRACLKTDEYKKMTEEFTNIFKSTIKDEKTARLSNRLKIFFSKVNFTKLRKGISLVTKERLRTIVDYLIPDVNIEDLPLKFCCVCADIIKGEKIVIKKGNLKKVIMGSIAIEGIIEPEKWGSRLLIDGGCVSKTPVRETREMGADFVIAVEVMSRIKQKDFFNDRTEVINRAYEMTDRELHKQILKEADLVVSPVVKDVRWTDFTKLDYCILVGESAEINLKNIV